MTYSEVCNILGGSGTLEASSYIPGDSTYGIPSYRCEIYDWSNRAGTKIVSVVFMNGKVESKSQAGLT